MNIGRIIGLVNCQARYRLFHQALKVCIANTTMKFIYVALEFFKSDVFVPECHSLSILKHIR